MCAGFLDLSTLLFHYLSRYIATPKLLHCHCVDGYGSAQLPTEKTARDIKNTQLRKRKTVHANQIDPHDSWNINGQNQVCTKCCLAQTHTETHIQSQTHCSVSLDIAHTHT